MASSPNDLQIVLVESHFADTATVSDSCIRYYDVGRAKDTEEGDEEDDVQSHDSEEEDNEEADDDEDDNEEDLGLLLFLFDCCRFLLNVSFNCTKLLSPIISFHFLFFSNMFLKHFCFNSIF